MGGQPRLAGAPRGAHGAPRPQARVRAELLRGRAGEPGRWFARRGHRHFTPGEDQTRRRSRARAQHRRRHGDWVRPRRRAAHAFARRGHQVNGVRRAGGGFWRVHDGVLRGPAGGVAVRRAGVHRRHLRDPQPVRAPQEGGHRVPDGHRWEVQAHAHPHQEDRPEGRREEQSRHRGRAGALQDIRRLSAPRLGHRRRGHRRDVVRRRRPQERFVRRTPNHRRRAAGHAQRGRGDLLGQVQAAERRTRRASRGGRGGRGSVRKRQRRARGGVERT
mmetsp:Transcript_13961/g.58754  ORF Transcript_13961/g.58754 Transcript_13961/m.58754 type:complete len:274 (+) Transcript_13961:960-1781(+)